MKRKWEHSFACGQSAKDLKNKNPELTEMLQKLGELNRNKGDRWRTQAYQKAASAISKYPMKITSAEQVKDTRFIGKRIYQKIEEFLSTGKLRRLQNLGEYEQTLNILGQVWGAGQSTIQRWYQQGIRSLKELCARQDELCTKNQKIGLRYYDEFNTRIPRKEVSQIQDRVQSVAKNLDPQIMLVVCGSYRRGKQNCGDIDILISHPNSEFIEGLKGRLIPYLMRDGILTDLLTGTTDKESKKVMGVCQLSKNHPHRRIDFQFIAPKSWGCALLYFTGSGYFNRSMRLLARKKHMSLSEKGLVIRHHSYDKTTQDKGADKGCLLSTLTERDVFEYLQIPYKFPEERNI